MTVKALIAEDEPLLAAELRDELAQLWPELEICAVVHDGHEALRQVEARHPDILFLDVQMPGLDGVALARLAGRKAHIVFVTAFDRYAVPAFDEGAVDYLLKPVEAGRLARAVQRLKERVAGMPAAAPAPAAHAGDAAAPAPPLRWISVLQGRDVKLIEVDDICYFRADHKYVAVVTTDGEALISTPLKDLLPRLDPGVFWQVHRGTVVNMRAVHSVARTSTGRMRLRLKQRPERLDVSAPYTHLFKQF